MEKTRQNWTLSQHAQELPERLRSFEAGDDSELEFKVDYALQQPWLGPESVTQVQATFRFVKDNLTTRIIVQTVDGVEFDLSQPVQCLPVTIPKQWGKEVWYSGIEARGESRVAGKGGSCSLATYLSFAPSILHGNLPLTLIKVLDPSEGNLYLEVHEEKQEVYVVSHIDKNLWPKGSGGIRLGVNQNTRKNFADDKTFREAFIGCAKAYEDLRKKIDSGCEYDTAELSAVENELESFTQVMPLQLGNVVKIPTWVPHSLQKGVRVVEFQTPTYERFIIAASQKVVTQPTWDSAQAINHMHLEPVENRNSQELADENGLVAQFSDFEVYRITVDQNNPYRFPDGTAYAFVVSMSHTIDVAGLSLGAEEVCFVPGYAQQTSITSQATTTCLITLPTNQVK